MPSGTWPGVAPPELPETSATYTSTVSVVPRNVVFTASNVVVNASASFEARATYLEWCERQGRPADPANWRGASNKKKPDANRGGAGAERPSAERRTSAIAWSIPVVS